jgi:GrpB-like predicted nucleotidyltransferase (UPF0157 family)
VTKQTIRVVEYDAAWPGYFEEEKQALAGAFGPYALAIEHVGSTSVPGLAAKPVIDIAVGMPGYPLPDEVIRRVEALGYDHRGEFGIPRRHYFRRNGPPCVFHVHANEIEGDSYRDQVLFRDYLRAHPEAAREYQVLKRDLTARLVSDFETYTESKTGFVQLTLEKARAWRQAGG